MNSFFDQVLRKSFVETLGVVNDQRALNRRHQRAEEYNQYLGLRMLYDRGDHRVLPLPEIISEEPVSCNSDHSARIAQLGLMHMDLLDEALAAYEKAA